MSSETSPEQKSGVLDPKANAKALGRIAVLLFVLIAGIWLFFRFTAGEKAANQVAATILRQPIEITNTIVDLPASSFRSITFLLPFTGTLLVEVSVMKGNEVDVYVVAPNELENIKAHKQFSFYRGFEAQKIKSYQRTGRLEAGKYCLVLNDKTLGILSQASSDLKVHLRLEP